VIKQLTTAGAEEVRALAEQTLVQDAEYRLLQAAKHFEALAEIGVREARATGPFQQPR
jgi:hypothetical protein